MSRRLEKINKHLQRTLGEILLTQAELPSDALVTIARVETTANLKSATVWLYVYPDSRAEAVLAELTPQLYHLQGALNRALDFRPLPRVRLRIDYGAQHADTVARKLDELNRQRPEATE